MPTSSRAFVSWSLLVASILAVSLLAVMSDVGARHAAARAHVHRLTLDALADTKLTTSVRLARVASDTGLIRNLDWQLDHSAASTLAAQVQDGVLDRIVVFDAACQPLAAAGRGAEPSCSPGQDATRKSLWAQWQHHGGHAVLSVALPLTIHGGQAGTIAASVGLGPAWLATRPKLARELASLDANLIAAAPSPIAAGSDYLAVAENGEATGSAPLLQFPHPYPWLQGLPGLPEGVMPRELLSLVTLIALGASVILLRQHILERRRALRAARELAAWMADHGMQDDLADAQESARHAASLLKTCQTALAKADERASNERARERERMLKLKSELDRRLVQRDELHARLAEAASHESLAIQVEMVSSTYLARLHALQERGEDLCDMLDDGLAKAVARLERLTGSWRAGIDERGARKFLRGLAETESSFPAKSLLDVDLDSMLQASSQAHDQALHARSHGREMVQDAVLASRIARLWLALASRDREPKATAPTFAHAFESALNLVHLVVDEADAAPRATPSMASAKGRIQGASKASSFDQSAPLRGMASFQGATADPDDPSHFSVDTPPTWPELPKVPEARLVAALFHLLMAVHGGRAQRLIARLRQEQHKTMIIWSAITNPLAPERSRTPFVLSAVDRTRHIEQARALLAPHGVEVVALPTTTGHAPIALILPDHLADRNEARRTRSDASKDTSVNQAPL